MGAGQSSLDDDGNPLKGVKKVDGIKFHLQEKEHVAKCENITPTTTLNEYLRRILSMTGTKGMCFEGGCGACVVVLQTQDPLTHKDVFLAVNSCLVPLLQCQDSRIFTIEGIGNAIDGYHPIQEVLAQFNGTQCGFCSPGMVMTMYALYESGKLTMEEVENSFSGNLCRCTGYRPILSAFKSLCKDASVEVLGECPDIEDFVVCYKEKRAKESQKPYTNIITESFYLELSESRWIKVHTLRDLLRILASNANLSYRLMAGTTAQGVYSSYREEVDIYIDISNIPELQQHDVTTNACTVGANTTLTNTIEFFQQVSKNYPQFAYLKLIADHIDLIANVPVRNRGTLAGNLMMKHDHPEFPSDVFLVLETAGANLTIVNSAGQESQLTPLEFINLDMKTERIVLKTISLPPYANTVKYVSYKIMPRAQNTHAVVNAGFLFKFESNDILQSATLVYGNISSTFAHATQTEKFLYGKKLFDNDTLKQACKKLNQEINPAIIPPDPAPTMRKQLAISLFYKAVLSIAPSDKVSPRNRSGGEILKRPLSSGTQDYETNKSLYPVTQAIPKLEALAQTSGEADYIIDSPELPNQLFGALVLAKAPPNSTIRTIDPTNALKLDDIVAFYDKDDIPGDNIFTVITVISMSEEELFCSGRVKYYEQPVGILIGKSRESVEKSTDLVKITYDSPNVEPLLTVRQVIRENRTDRITQYQTIPRKRTGNNVKHVVKGIFDIYHQYHFHMETQVCLVVPTENELNVYSSTQWMDLVQSAIARVLKIPQSKIYVKVRRCGGAFGAKITRANLVACATALASWKLKKPVKVWLPLTTNMVALGKRFPFSCDYEVAVDDNGVIQRLDCTTYTDVGYQLDENISIWIERVFANTYISDTFNILMNRVTTDIHVNTWCRAPGSLEGVAAVEAIMEHIAYSVGADPIDVRLANMVATSPLRKYVADIKSWANIDQRKAEIATFNKENRWKKKGLSVIPMYYDLILFGPHIVVVSIFHDGSVQITHGGIEIGQGINTKAAQTCAFKFGIPLERITILPSNSFATPNNLATGGSIASEGICYGVIQACDVLLARIKPYNPAGTRWEDAVRTSYQNNVNLTATGLYEPNQPGLRPYSIFGVCAAEVFVDILTGQHFISRVDIIEDTGDSTNPVIDIGQVEGGFVMGLGYHTTEKIVFSYEGQILTRNTWTYLVPGAKDIPVHFNVKFPKNNPNPVGVLKSKATGEPAICLSISIALAIRNALASARKDAGSSNSAWYLIDGTTDLEDIYVNSLNDSSQYLL